MSDEDHHHYHPDYMTYGRSGHLRRRYGLSEEDYQAILNRQQGVCAVCKRHPVKIRLSVDHNHRTGHIRGLLCSACNYHRTHASLDRHPKAWAAYLIAPPAFDVIGERVVPEATERSKV